ncbi:MAG TPA: cache domain-containing protein, partial [Candidatus Limnocylindria bacterium]|nr:cache domain-containing protein [Candidatus Limnocylindria bacterium]
MSPLLISVAATALVWAAVAAVYIVLLRKRVLARFSRGFLYSMLLAMVGVALMSSTIIGVWGYKSAQQLLEEEVIEELADIGSIVETELANQRNNVHRQLSAFGTSLVPLLDKGASSTELSAKLHTALSLNDRFLELHVFDEQGRTVASSSRLETTEPISRQAIGANLDGQPFVSEAEKSKSFGREVLFISEPLKDASGAVRGAIGTRFDLQDELKDLVGGIKFNQSGYASMVDGEGQVIAHPDEQRLERVVSHYPAVKAAWLSGGTGSLVADNDRGQHKLFVYRAVENPATLPRQKWVLLTEIDAAELVAPVKKLRDELFVGILLLLIISVVIGHQVSYSVDKPLQELGAFAHRIGTGDLTGRATVSGHDVAGRLAASLNEMAAGLQERDHVKEVFGRYIATQVSDQILSGQVNLGGEARVVTILFSDIRNFTGMSEQMTPQQVVAFLNDYFSEMVDAVFEHHGVLDKFMGDGLM